MDDQQGQNAFSQMAAALDGHEVTDDEGQVAEDTASLESAPEETNTEEETATGENPAESTAEDPKSEEVESENQLAEDESGKRYVPEPRFKKVYGDLKARDRELAAERAEKAQLMQQLQGRTPIYQPDLPVNTDRSAQLETEMLYNTLPQFNPESEDYDQTLDQTAVDIFLANPGITKMEAGRRAIARAKALTKDQTKIIAEARTVKSQQADQGITSRVSNRPSDEDKVPGDDATLEEMEAYLKKTGEWNQRR